MPLPLPFPMDTSMLLSPNVQDYLHDNIASLLSGAEVSSIILSLCLISIVIPSLFFVVGSKVESEVVTTQAYHIVDGLTMSLQNILTPDQRAALKPYLDQYIEAPDLSQADAEVAKKNSALVSKAYTYIGIGVGCALLIILGIWLKSRFKVGHMLVENLFIVAIVAAVELSVLYFVGRNFKSANVNFVKLKLVEALQAYGASAS